MGLKIPFSSTPPHHRTPAPASHQPGEQATVYSTHPQLQADQTPQIEPSPAGDRMEKLEQDSVLELSGVTLTTVKPGIRKNPGTPCPLASVCKQCLDLPQHQDWCHSRKVSCFTLHTPSCGIGLGHIPRIVQVPKAMRLRSNQAYCQLSQLRYWLPTLPCSSLRNHTRRSNVYLGKEKRAGY